MNMIFRSPPQIPSRKMPFWKLKKAKKSRIHNDALVLFPHFRTAEKGMTWPWRDHLKRYFTELIQLKYKLILWIKTMGCCSLACVVWLKSWWVLEEKISLNCCQVQHDVPVTEIFEFNLHVNFSLFFMKLSELVGYFYYLWEAKSIWKKSKPLK